MNDDYAFQTDSLETDTRKKLTFGDLVREMFQIALQRNPRLRRAPADGERAALTVNLDISGRIECGMRSAQLEQFELFLHDRIVQSSVDLLQRQIGAVDLLVTILTRTAYGLMVVFAAEQIEVPDLGFGRHEQLDCTCQQHFGIVFAQCAVILT